MYYKINHLYNKHSYHEKSNTSVGERKISMRKKDMTTLHNYVDEAIDRALSEKES